MRPLLLLLLTILPLVPVSPEDLGRARAKVREHDLRGAAGLLEGAGPPDREARAFREACLALAAAEDDVRRALDATPAAVSGAISAPVHVTATAHPVIWSDADLRDHAVWIIFEAETCEGSLAAADASFAKGEWIAARRGYRAAAAGGLAGARVKLHSEARIRRCDEELEPGKIASDPLRKLGGDVVANLGTLVSFGLSFLLAIGLIALIRSVSRRLREPWSSVTVLDASGAPNAGLGSRFTFELHALRTDAKAGRRIDRLARLGVVIPPLVPPTPLLGVPAPPLGAAKDKGIGRVIDLLGGTPEVTIGFLKFSPTQIWALISEFFSPPRYDWRIMLNQDGETRATLTMRDRVEDSVERSLEQLTPGIDVGAAEEALRLLACDVALSIEDPPPTRSAHAYRELRAAGIKLGTDPRVEPSPTALKEARGALERAVRADPDLWQARVQLAIVLKKLGQIALARATIDSALLAKEKLGRREFELLEAAIDLESTRYERVKGAEEKLAALADDAAAKDAHRVRARLLLLGAKARLLNESEFDPQVKPYRANLREQVNAMHAKLGSDDVEGLDPRALAVARAEARTQYGYVRLADCSTAAPEDIGKFAQEARKIAQDALQSIPDLPDAVVLCARAIRKMNESDWLRQVEALLGDFLTRRPDDAAANEELGHALRIGAPTRLKEIEAALGKAAEDRHFAAFELGTALLKDRPAEGVPRIWRAIEMARDRAPARYGADLISWIASLPELEQEPHLKYGRRALRWMQARLEAARNGRGDPEAWEKATDAATRDRARFARPQIDSVEPVPGSPRRLLLKGRQLAAVKRTASASGPDAPRVGVLRWTDQEIEVELSRPLAEMTRELKFTLFSAGNAITAGSWKPPVAAPAPAPAAAAAQAQAQAQAPAQTPATPTQGAQTAPAQAPPRPSPPASPPPAAG